MYAQKTRLNCRSPSNALTLQQLLNFRITVDIFVYRLQEEEVVEEEDESGEFASFQVMSLPHVNLDGLWDALVYGEDIKRRLLDYVYTAMLFTQKGVNSHVVGWNRVVLLHGPPGTGKTSLCKALSHQLSLRLRRNYTSYELIEINAHSLFSKWFSESGKLVMKMFAAIREFASDPTRFVSILIDEVESLTAARSKAMSGSEPSDAIRVVNAVLTELDKIKQLPNILVLTTSNITGAIDEAFLDRADIVQYIGPPTVQARYEILAQCMNELSAKGLIKNPSPAPPLVVNQAHVPTTSNSDLLKPSIIPQFRHIIDLIGVIEYELKEETNSQFEASLKELVGNTLLRKDTDLTNLSKLAKVQHADTTDLSENERASLKLLESAFLLDGLSGRALRKVPFVAASTILHGSTSASLFKFAEAIGVAGSKFSSKHSQTH